MEVSELSGAMLDYWVAKAEGAEDDDLGWRITAQGSEIKSRILDWRMSIYAPHRRWEQAGPIIEREGMSLMSYNGLYGRMWCANNCNQVNHASPLVAAMRAYVASKYGEEVPDAAELGKKGE